MKVQTKTLKNEVRSINSDFKISVETRKLENGDSKEDTVIIGYGLRYNEWSETMGIPGYFEFKEKIAPGAAREAIKNIDMRALFNHDAGKVLGRMSAGTLEIEEDDFGLRYKIKPPDTSYARDLIESIKRGDIKESSFAFVIGSNEEDDEWVEIEDGKYERTIHRFEKIIEVSPVAFPAYPSASSGVREVNSDNYQEIMKIIEQKRSWQNELRLRKLALEEY